MPMSVDPGNCITRQRAINRIEGVAGLQSLRSSLLDTGREEKRKKQKKHVTRTGKKVRMKKKRGWGEKYIYMIRTWK